MSEITFAECEDVIEKLTKVPETTEDEAEAAVQMLFGALPNIEGLRQMRWGLANLKKVFFVCSGPPSCDDNECVGKPDHQRQYAETISPVVDQLEKDIEQLKRETTIWFYKYANCRCPSCRTQEKVNASRWN